jgi:hypothetical protein
VEIIDGWEVPDVEVFASDLEPVVLIPHRTTMMHPLSRSSRSAPRAEMSNACCRSRTPSTLSHSSQRHAPQLSEHPALPFSGEPLAAFAWNIRDLHFDSVCLAASENSHMVRVVFALFAAVKHETPRSRRMSALVWRGRRTRTRRPPA